MKINKIKSYLAVAAFVALSASISSCNRGYGCPNNFSLSEKAVQAGQAIVADAAALLVK